MKKYYALLLFTMITPLQLLSGDLVKTGVYDFKEILNYMGDEPYLRNIMPDILQKNLFLTKMLESDKTSLFRSNTSSLRTEEKIEYYATQKYLHQLGDQFSHASNQKSSTMKKYLYLGIYASRLYDGYNLILNPSTKILFYDKDSLSKSISHTLVDYLKDQEKHQAEAEKTNEGGGIEQ